jgi:hypothetical protein
MTFKFLVVLCISMYRIITVIAFVFITFGLQAQSINTEFGKNRVQFHDDFNNWWEYETPNFITYWYGKGRFIAQPVLQLAEMDHDEIQNILEHRMNDKIEIIVYVDVSDLKQSNIGTEESFNNKTGETKIVGNKMFVYFDGNHQNLRQKIKEGIATVYYNNMLYGSNLQEIIQNAVLMNIPDWYGEGVVSYAAHGWSQNKEDELRDIWENKKKYRDFNKFSEDNPKLAGHSFWFFIDQNYGKSAISNLLYLTKISRGMDNSFEYILNADLPMLKAEWKKFYTQYYESEKGKFVPKSDKSEERLSNKKYTPISNIKLSPNGEQLLYAYNDQGKFRVVIRDIKSGEEKRIFKYGYKNYFQETDYNYPILAWHPTKPEVSIAYEHKDVIKLIKYNLKSDEKMEQIIPTDFQRLYTISYINDLDYIFSASLDGFSDLFLYKSKNRNYQRLTNDFYDDLDAEYVTIGGQSGILFSSNRTRDTLQSLTYDTIIPVGNFDLFFWPDGATKFQQLTNTENINERYAYPIGTQKLSYLSDASGVTNNYIYDHVTKNSYAISNLDRNIIRHHAVVGQNAYVTTYYKDGMYKLYAEKVDVNTKVQPYNTQARFLLDENTQQNVFIPFEPEIIDVVQPTIEYEMMFQSEFQDPQDLEPIKTTITPESNIPSNFKLSSERAKFGQPKPIQLYDTNRAIPANKKFALSNIVTKMDNELLFEGLESYTGDRQQLLTLPMGVLLKANLKDLFEDYSVEGGVRIPTSFNGSEYFLVFDNKKSRIDKRFALYRKSNKYSSQIDPTQTFLTRSKKTSLLAMYQMKYPFDIYRSVRATSIMRFDRFLQLSTENNSFLAPAVNEKRLSLKVEYIYDNTHDAALNIKHGTRYKFYVEAINQFDMQLLDGFTFDLAQGFTGIIGYDARHYIPLLGNSVLALRSAGATSMGSKKMLYFIGGVENSIFPNFDNSIPVNDDGQYSYKANAFHLRGFDNNIRNGSSFVLANAELRIPFMQYLLGKNRGTSFFKNMQIIGFYDAGLAWYGLTPFSEENPLNKVTITSPPLIQLNVEYFRDPLVMGYGVGFRTQLLGYFVKLDRAWGVETRAVQAPKWYVSFGMDF